MRALRRLAVACAVAAGGVAVCASPAGAHGLGGPTPTNYRTDLRGVRPPVPGIVVRVLDFGDRIELTNRTARPVVVLGYEGEPYLRVTRDGVWENRRSPAGFLNRTAIPRRDPPPGFDASAPAVWRRVRWSGTYRWHDHRAHWMATEPPPAVQAEPGRPHTVIRGFRVPLRVGDTRAAVVGDVRWVPGPAPWRWLGAAAGTAAAVTLVGRTRRWPAVLVVALLLAVASEAAHVVGAWRFSTASLPSRLGANLYSMAGIAVALVAVRQLVRNPWAAVPAALVAGVFVLLAGGLAGITALSRSQLPTTLPAGAARATVAAALGLGLGIVVTTATRLRLPAPAALALRVVAVAVPPALALPVVCGVGPAGAHVTVEPPVAPRGGFATFAFTVPNERDDVGTTGLEVVFPADHPITTVAVEPVAGWTVTVQRRPSPGGTAEVVDRIVWRGGPIRPGEFQRFWISAGPLPRRGSGLVFAALQTYADGEIVRWIEPVPSSGAEPEFPAPQLRLRAPGEASGAGAGESGARARTDPDTRSASRWSRAALVLAAVALAVAAVALRRATRGGDTRHRST